MIPGQGMSPHPAPPPTIFATPTQELYRRTGHGMLEGKSYFIFNLQLVHLN